MKKILGTIALFAVISLVVISCKKARAKTPAEQIVGSWQVANLVYNEHTSGADHIISSNDFTAADTYDFRADGSVYANVKGSTDTSTYSISADNKLTIVNDETYDIKALDDHSLVLYVKNVSGADYTEVTISFKR